MRLFAVILTAFFVQSCYTMVYSVNDRPASGEVTIINQPVIVVEPPYDPCPPVPAPVIYDPAPTTVTQLPDDNPARLRNDPSARVPAAGVPSNPEPARLRTPSAGSSSKSQSTGTTNPNGRSDREAAGGHAPAGQTQTARPRTR